MRFFATSPRKSKLSVATSWYSSSSVSSKDIKIPGSSYLVTPLIRKLMQKRVFPVPVPPERRVVLLRGRPPSVISSKPLMPVGHLGSGGGRRAGAFLMRLAIRSLPGSGIGRKHLFIRSAPAVRRYGTEV